MLDLDYFCPSGETRGLRKFFVQEEKGRKGVGLRIICPSKREKKIKVKGKASQKRSKESRPLSGKASNDHVRFPDRLQNNSMLPFHATNTQKACSSHGNNKKKACSSHGFLLVAAGANRKKARVRIFCKNYLCNFIGLFVSPAFLFLNYST